MTYQLLEDLDNDFRFSARPVQVWVLLTIEIAFRFDDSVFLVAKQPYYADAADGERLFEGAWAPPFVGVPVENRFDMPGSPAALRDRIAAAENGLRPDDILGQVLYEMGIENASIEERASFVELKKSPRSPDLLKAYKIRRFGVRTDLSSSKSNIADPDGRKGFVFLPVDSDSPVYRRDPGVEGTTRWSFLGLPLMTNLATVLGRPAEVRQIRDSAFRIERSYFFREQESLILCFDISGYGRALEYVRVNLRSVDEDGQKLSEFFSRRLAEWFAQFLTRVGARQVQHTGDGFVCSLARFEPTELGFVVGELKILQDSLVEISRALSAEVSLGSRMSIYRGSYRYGRVAGPLSSVPGFDGEGIVTAVRMEQGLADFLRNLPAKPGTHAVVVAVGDDELEGIFPEDDWEFCGKEKLSAKEYTGQGTVMIRRVAV